MFQAKQLKDTYLPIEFDGTKTIAEKIPHMIEWWVYSPAFETARCVLLLDVEYSSFIPHIKIVNL